MKNINSFNSEQVIEINNEKFKFFDLNKVADHFDINLNKIPISIKVILENLRRWRKCYKRYDFQCISLIEE